MQYQKLLPAMLLGTVLTGCDSAPVETESSFATDSAEQAAAAGVSHGEYVARLGNCVACHSVEDGAALAGGLRMEVPFLGAIYSTNITPDPETGIGNYSFEEFDRAMRFGVAKDGHRLYPAMPYPSYAKMSEQDMRALYDFLMNEVEPVNQPNKESEIPTWKSPRWPMVAWNLLYLEDEPYTSKEEQSEEWNRGAYLIQGLGHCGACHTPRGLLFQEKALDESDTDFLAGAELDHWYASTLNGDINSGLGRMSVEDVAEFLKTGHNRFGTAFGTMVEVVNNSTAHMSDEDVNAMAVYLKSLPPVAEADEEPWEYNPSDAEQLVNLNFEEPGARVYYQYCSTCHATSGKGYYPYQPPLAGNPVVMDKDPASLINITLNGSLRVIAEQGPDVNDMPYFRRLLSDQEVADVVTYIRNSWGNSASPVSAEEVAEIRAATDPTQNQDIFTLKMK